MTSHRRIALFGECMIELRGRAFEAMQQSFGGDTLNTAVYLARLCRGEAITVSYATALGTDPFSEHMLKAWRGEGIDTSLVRQLEDRLPGLYAIEVDASGERRFFYWRDASAARSYFASHATPLEDSAKDLAALYASGISFAILPPEGRERLLAAMARVRAGGGLVVFDNNFRSRLWPDLAQARLVYQRAYALSDIILVTLEDEMALRGQVSADGALSNVLALGAREVVVKRGAEPTLVRIEDEPAVAVPVESIRRVVDTTAAGDSFAGAYLAMRLTGVPPVAAARAANRMAAVVIQHPGAVIPSGAMPTRETLLAADGTSRSKGDDGPLFPGSIQRRPQ
jgi:2-dehydro-3-deoxygluconokinase